MRRFYGLKARDVSLQKDLSVTEKFMSAKVECFTSELTVSCEMQNEILFLESKEETLRKITG